MSRAMIDQPCFKVYPLTRFFFQLIPIMISSLQQRHIVGMFKISFADDAALPGMRTLFVRDIELLKSEYLITSFGQFIAGRGSHGTHTDYNHIVLIFFHERLLPD